MKIIKVKVGRYFKVKYDYEAIKFLRYINNYLTYRGKVSTLPYVPLIS